MQLYTRRFFAHIVVKVDDGPGFFVNWVGIMIQQPFLPSVKIFSFQYDFLIPNLRVCEIGKKLAAHDIT